MQPMRPATTIATPINNNSIARPMQQSIQKPIQQQLPRPMQQPQPGLMRGPIVTGQPMQGTPRPLIAQPRPLANNPTSMAPRSIAGTPRPAIAGSSNPIGTAPIARPMGSQINQPGRPINSSSIGRPMTMNNNIISENGNLQKPNPIGTATIPRPPVANMMQLQPPQASQTLAPPQFSTQPPPPMMMMTSNPASNLPPPPMMDLHFGAPPPPPPPPLMEYNGMPASQPPSSYPSQPMAQQQPINLNPDYQCPSHFTRLTCSKFPSSAQIASQTTLPIGGVIQPLKQDDEPIPVVNFGATVVRCKRCRAYINPFVSWLENGRRWKCNICQLVNDTTNQYYCQLDSNGDRIDTKERPELSKGIIEIVATSEYMVRSPVPPAFVFVIDVSYDAVMSGMLKSVADTIKAALDNLPGSTRAQIAIITYDSSVHFYNLSPNLSFPQMLVVGDIDDLFLPIADDILVNVSDSRNIIDKLLDSLPALHANSISVDCALGPAINSAFRVMQHLGGKLCIFQTKVPNLGEGIITPRDPAKLVSSEREKILLQCANEWYRSKADMFSQQQICVELFSFPKNHQQVCDLATVSILARNTGGQVHFFPTFHPMKDGEKLFQTLYRSLTRETAWEAVMRVRASNGIRVSAYYGNFLIRGTDLLSLPNCDADASFGFELAHEEGVILTQPVTVQAALLYTNSDGERRIRVTTQCIPVANSPMELMNSANDETVAHLLAKINSSITFSFGPEDARARLQNRCTEIVRSCKALFSASIGPGMASSMPGIPGQQGSTDYQQAIANILPQNLQRLPSFILALIKHPVFRGGTDILPDERVSLLTELNRLPLRLFDSFVLPHFFAIHGMPQKCGDIIDINRFPIPETDDISDYRCLGEATKLVKLPPKLSLTAQHLHPGGIFLLYTGYRIQLWIGRSAPPGLLQSLFGASNLEKIDSNVLRIIPAQGDDIYKTRISNIITSLQQSQPSTFAQLEIIKEGDSKEIRFYWNLVEDRATFTGGSITLNEFIMNIMR